MKRRIVLTAVMLAVVLPLGAGPAPASSGIETSVAAGELGRITKVSREFVFEEPATAINVTCEITRTLRYQRVILKVRGELVAQVTAVTQPRNCRGGTVRMLVEGLPWAKTYISFAGTLPNISSITSQVEEFAFLIEAFFGVARCLYKGNLKYITSGGNIISLLRTDERTGIPLSEMRLSAMGCPERIFIRARLTVTPEVRLRLI